MSLLKLKIIYFDTVNGCVIRDVNYILIKFLKIQEDRSSLLSVEKEERRAKNLASRFSHVYG